MRPVNVTLACPSCDDVQVVQAVASDPVGTHRILAPCPRCHSEWQGEFMRYFDKDGTELFQKGD